MPEDWHHPKGFQTCLLILYYWYTILHMKGLNLTDHSAMWTKVYEHVREKIFSGEIAPGQRLVEATVAKEIGISRTPVREAFHNLQKDGLIESIPRVGYRVLSISEEEVIQICKIREALEIIAAKWAMQRSYDTLVKELDSIIARSEKTISQSEIHSFADLDAQFHETIARLSGSSHIMEITQVMRRHMVRHRITSFLHADVFLRALDGHKLIYKAIERRDADEVERAIRYHLDLSLRDILAVAPKEETQVSGQA
ncbi:MAG: putative HTH-type transcriptional regulator YdfH [Syntrophorhabdaceae bacterium PtaU1.Bin034]|nr:MAG: putative HTH-type transcriptional regulator YdfH [Syntrophorhabdaceae bacterium PtaU1.Bin034]